MQEHVVLVPRRRLQVWTRYEAIPGVFIEALDNSYKLAQFLFDVCRTFFPTDAATAALFATALPFLRTDVQPEHVTHTAAHATHARVAIRRRPSAFAAALVGIGAAPAWSYSSNFHCAPVAALRAPTAISSWRCRASINLAAFVFRANIESLRLVVLVQHYCEIDRCPRAKPVELLPMNENVVAEHIEQLLAIYETETLVGIVGLDEALRTALDEGLGRRVGQIWYRESHD
mmetsp:Transcript_102405/g.289269  ORF Transcript_102405/g.289269 Transcript_102405/m.289269 type:complete len:231 (-) Transcript_102405:171-863(-)